jgi:hypothetical protein
MLTIFGHWSGNEPIVVMIIYVGYPVHNTAHIPGIADITLRVFVHLLLPYFNGIERFLCYIILAYPAVPYVYNCGKKYRTINIIGIMNVHTKYHQPHSQGGCCKIVFQVFLLGAQKVYPDTGHMTAEEQILGERCINRLHGILQEQIPKHNNTARWFQRNEQYTYLPYDGYNEMHFDDTQNYPGFIEVRDNDCKQGNIKKKKYSRRKIEAREKR